MPYTEIPDLLFKGAKVYTLEDATTSTDPAPTPTPPAPTPPPVVVTPPALIANRAPLVTPVPWVNGSRLFSPAKLGLSNYWALLITPKTGFSTLRLVGAENGGGPQAREWVIFRADTGEVLQHDTRPMSTVQVRCAIARAADPRYFEVRIDPTIDYVLGVITSVGLPASQMFMDVFLS